jgi:hypothetical protein
MSISDDRWFEVWCDEGEDVAPGYLLIVTPDKKRPGYVVVLDPLEKFKIDHEGEKYE